MEEAKSASLVFIWVFSVQVELEFGNVVFPEGRKTGAARYKPSEHARTNNKLNPHIEPGWYRTRITLEEGVLSPLCHPYSPRYQPNEIHSYKTVP